MFAVMSLVLRADDGSQERVTEFETTIGCFSNAKHGGGVVLEGGLGGGDVGWCDGVDRNGCGGSLGDGPAVREALGVGFVGGIERGLTGQEQLLDAFLEHGRDCMTLRGLEVTALATSPTSACATPTEGNRRCLHTQQRLHRTTLSARRRRVGRLDDPKLLGRRELPMRSWDQRLAPFAPRSLRASILRP